MLRGREHIKKTPKQISITKCLFVSVEICSQNLTTRLLEARPQDAKAYLLNLLEAFKASRVQKDAAKRFCSNNDAPSVEPCEQRSALPHALPHAASRSTVDPLSSRLGIFSEKDLQVLFDYCTRTKGGGAAKELQTCGKHKVLGLVIFELFKRLDELLPLIQEHFY